MWHSKYSTGITELDNDHAHIDAVIGYVAESADPESEKRHLMDVYCAIISHVQYKNDLLGPDLSREEQEHDTKFLRDVRSKMQERATGLISRRQLITDLRQMLMMHAMSHENEERLSA